MVSIRCDSCGWSQAIDTDSPGAAVGLLERMLGHCAHVRDRSASVSQVRPEERPFYI